MEALFNTLFITSCACIVGSIVTYVVRNYKNKEQLANELEMTEEELEKL